MPDLEGLVPALLFAGAAFGLLVAGAIALIP